MTTSNNKYHLLTFVMHSLESSD